MSRVGLTIRPFETRDRQAVIALWNTVFADDPPWNAPETVIDRKLGIQRELFLVGSLDGRLAATVVAGFDGFRGWVYHLAVEPDRQRAGLGRAMMEEAEARLRALGCPKVNLQVRADNRAVVHFYRALGYRIEDRVSLAKILE